MPLVLTVVLCGAVVLLFRVKVLPSLRRRAAVRPVPRTIGGWIVIAELISKVALVATIAFGIVAVTFIAAVRGSRGSTEAISEMLAAFHAAHALYEMVAGGWTVFALTLLAMAYFSAVHRRSSSLFRERLDALVATETARLEQQRAAGGWADLPDDEEMSAIRADLDTVTRRRETSARVNDAAAVALHDRHLKELWGKLYFADRNRRVDVHALVRQILSERPAGSNAFFNLLTSRLAVAAMPRATKLLAALGLPLLLASLVGLRTGYVREAAESRLTDLRVLESPEKARQSFEAALGTIPPYRGGDPKADAVQINAIARAYELRWVNAATRSTPPQRETHRYDDIRAHILDEYTTARAKDGVRLELRNVAERRPPREPQSEVGRKMRDALDRIGKRSGRELDRILALARETDAADLPHSSRSEVADAFFEVFVNSAISATPVPPGVLGDIVKEGLEHPARKLTQAKVDAEVIRAATAALSAQTKDDIRRALEPRRGMHASAATMQPLFAKRGGDLTERAAFEEERAYSSPAGVAIAGGQYDSMFPVLDTSTTDAASRRPYDPKALEGFAHVGGVIIGTDAEHPRTLALRDFSWQFTSPDAVTIFVTNAQGVPVKLGPYHPSVVAQALAYVADDRRAVASAGTVGDKDVEIHPVLDQTPLGVRAVLLDFLADAYARETAGRSFRSVDSAITVYSDLVAFLRSSGKWKPQHVQVEDLAAFTVEAKTPFTAQSRVYDRGLVEAVGGCRTARFYDDLVACVEKQLPASHRAGLRYSDVHAWMYGVRETSYALSDDLAFVTQQRSLNFVGQLTYRCDPLSERPCDTVDRSFVDKQPWAFPDVSAKIDKIVREHAYSECRNIVAPMEDFTRLGRLFRAALRGSLGPQFPAEKLVRLARETAPFVRTAAVTWPRDSRHPCKSKLAAL